MAATDRIGHVNVVELTREEQHALDLVQRALDVEIAPLVGEGRPDFGDSNGLVAVEVKRMSSTPLLFGFEDEADEERPAPMLEGCWFAQVSLPTLGDLLSVTLEGRPIAHVPQDAIRAWNHRVQRDVVFDALFRAIPVLEAHGITDHRSGGGIDESDPDWLTKYRAIAHARDVIEASTNRGGCFRHDWGEPGRVPVML